MAKVFRLPGMLVVALIRGYQLSLGRLVGGRCRFHPSCSDYAAAAITENGLIVGGAQAAWRLLRCGPWSAGGIDPVKSRRHREAFGG
jgi:uncharacterized protein